MVSNDDDIIPVSEAARLSGYTREWIYKLIDRGQLTKYTNALGQVRVSLREVKALFQFRPEGKEPNQ